MSKNRLNPSLPVHRTTCPYCGVGCGVLAQVDESGVVQVSGDPEHPANRGSLCSKGTALAETTYHAERLLYPEIAGQQVGWEQALNAVAGRFNAIIREHGPDAVAFYVSGQLLTEDYYVANKLMKGFIGSANIDTNSRLCMSSAVAGYKRAFGEDAVPCCYDDIDRARLILLVGSNAAWCHPVLFQRIARARKANGDLQVVLLDPRRTQTASIADVHLALKPGSDAVFFNGLLAWLASQDEGNAMFTGQFTSGLPEALAAAADSAPDIASVAAQCELDATEVEQVYRLFARNDRTLTLFSQGVNQSSSGVDKVNSIINCHLFTGRIGRPGMGPFSLTGQPNAMGGREVGGLSNQLAAHMELGDAAARQRVQRFWQAPKMADRPGLMAVDLFDAITRGEVKAVWIMATNPVVSLPDADKVRAALQQCELVVLSDCVAETDTAALADIRLPAMTWGERDGTVTNSERCISRQRPFLRAPGLARPDWWIITEVARRMGFADAFDYRGPADVFSEHAALSGVDNDAGEGLRRQFDISALADISAAGYDALEPLRWPLQRTQAAQPPAETARLFSDGRFSTADGKARFVALQPRPPASQVSEAFPFVLNTGRVRDHWHTMTRTGMSPRLSSHVIEPYVEIHPDDALTTGVADAELAQVSSPRGASVFVRVRVSDKQRRGSLFVPMHWNDHFSSQARVGSLVRAVVDPISGQPESKHSVAAIAPCQARWYGFLISRRRPELAYSRYWTRSRGRGLWRYELAGQAMPEDWPQHARQLLGDLAQPGEWVEFHDPAQSHYRVALLTKGRLDACLFVDRTPMLPPRDWLIGLFQQPQLSAAERSAILTGEPPAAVANTGRVVCSCFNVGEVTLLEAIREHGLSEVEQIGERLAAGSNCGSCKPELAELIERARA